MNISSLLLGHFNNNNNNNTQEPFLLHRIENTSILLFKLNDVVSFFNLPSTHEVLEKVSPTDLFYRDVNEPNDIYTTTSLLASLAIKHNKFLLAELCKLKPTDYAANLADSILANIPRLDWNKGKKDISQYKSTKIELVESSINDTAVTVTVTATAAMAVKSEPISPPPMLSSSNKQQSDPMAIDTMLSHNNGNGAGSQPTNQQTRRLSRTLEDLPNKKLKKNDLLPKPIHTVSSQQQQQRTVAAPTLLAKRLNNSVNFNKKNLTIYAPSYGEQFLSSSIRSAPLNSNFLRSQQQQKGTQPHPLSQTTLRSPATASTTTTEFAIPPIVPSQQQPPHTAHPSSNHHFPPHSPLYPSSAYGHSFPVTSGRVIVDPPPLPKTPTTSSSSNSLQRQQFMQPFEHLFDTIETARTLKSTLDDQIRRSSTLMQTLQASSTTIEGLVRNQIKEVQKEILNRMEESLDHLFQRITVLERRAAAARGSGGVSNGNHDPMEDIEEEREQKEGEEDVERHVESTSVHSGRREQEQGQRSSRRELVSPPTIVKSQNDIGPNEYHVMLDTLRERLDRLERQLES